MNAIGLSLTVPVRVRRKEGCFVASCEPLDVFSRGNTKKEAVKHFIVAMRTIVGFCLKRELLVAFLKDAGFAPDNRLDPPKEEGRTVKIKIPLVSR